MRLSGPAWDAAVHDSGLLLIACLLGGLIGWQREAEGRAAGLRTHVLVCLGSCLITCVSFGMGDPGRIAAQIVTGIGFLGAGVILRRGVSVRGLTTAATIWVVAGIGIAVGASTRFALLAAFATVLVLLTLTLARRLESVVGKNRRTETLLVTVPRRTGAVGQMLEALTKAGADVVGFDSDDPEAGGELRTVQVQLRLRQDVTRAALSQILSESLPQAHFAWEEAEQA